MESGISATSVKRILTNDLELKPYKIVVEPSFPDDQKNKQQQFANRVRTNFLKEDIVKILLSDEKLFDIVGVYNAQNIRV